MTSPRQHRTCRSMAVMGSDTSQGQHAHDGPGQRGQTCTLICPSVTITLCYTPAMTYNAINVIECLVEDYGWDAVLDVLTEQAATAPDEHLAEIGELLDAAITVNEGKGQLFVL